MFDDYFDIIQQLIAHTIHIYTKRYKSDEYLMYQQKVQYCADAFNHCLNMEKYDLIFDLDTQSIDNIFKICVDIIDGYGI